MKTDKQSPVAALVSLASLNVNAACDTPFTFDFLDPDGNETGIKISVIGKESTPVKAWLKANLNKRRVVEARELKMGKAKTRRVEDDEAFGHEYLAVRVVGWEGIKEECSLENVMTLCEINPSFVQQVELHSENLSNFMTSK